MENTFEMACTEVLEVLKFLPKDEYKKIPKSEIEFLESKKDINYEFKIDELHSLEQINISKRANAIIIVLWEKYFASENQKQKLHVILRENYNKEEERKKEQYSYENLFKKDSNTYLVSIKKEKWYERIYGFFKKIVNNLSMKGREEGDVREKDRRKNKCNENIRSKEN